MAVASLAALVSAIKSATGFRTKYRERLVYLLVEIKDALQAIDKSLKARKVPTEQSYRLAVLINFAEDVRRGPFYFPHVDILFDEMLPRLGYLLRSADVFIDGKPRKGVPHAYMRKAREEDYQVPSGLAAVVEARKQIKRALGQIGAATAGLSAASRKGRADV